MEYNEMFSVGVRLQVRHRRRRTQNHVHVRRTQLPQVDELNSRPSGLAVVLVGTKVFLRPSDE